MGHDLCLSSHFEEFPLVGNPDAEDLGLGRATIFSGNAGAVVKWYAWYCRGQNLNWGERLSPPVGDRFVTCDLDAWTAVQDSIWPTPEWADPDPIDRHIALVDAFLAFAPGARFGAS